MDRQSFFRQSRVLVVAGKGGVGKTTVAAALARVAADAGLDVLVVALDSGGTLPILLGAEEGLFYEEQSLYEARGGRVRARVITPDDALLEYLVEHGMKRVAKRLVSTGVLDVVATAIPGIREILVLGKVKQLERGGAADLIVLDAPATGHAVRFLTSATGLVDAARGGPLKSQAADVVEMLHDPERCQVMLVTLPEETPVNELVETAYRFEDEIGILLGPVIVNACYDLPAPMSVLAATSTEASALRQRIAAAAAAAGEVVAEEQLAALAKATAWRFARLHSQQAQLERLAAALPLPEVRLPYLFHPEASPRDVPALAGALGTEIDRLDAGQLAAATRRARLSRKVDEADREACG